MRMSRILVHLVASLALLTLSILPLGQELSARSPVSAPLELVGKFEFPSEVKGMFDHLVVDPKGHRLFTATEHHKSVDVFDLRTHKLIHTISGIEKPHGLFYREDLNRLYVTDGGAGDLKIFNGKTYDLIDSVKLLPDADSVIYDPATKYLYVVNGGGDAKMTYSTISIIDTTKGEKVADMKIEGDTLEAMEIESYSPKLYVNNPAKNQVEVIDRNTRAVIASWPVTLCKENVAMALDEAHHRLFLGCRSGHIVVVDTENGKDLQTLQISQGVDDMSFDPASRRLYAVCPSGAGSVYVYEETNPGHYKSLGQVPSGPGGRNGRLVPEINRFFVSVPQHDSTNAAVLEYKVQ
jgi:DNA-binding beta-propeller fold protein YncE